MKYGSAGILEQETIPSRVGQGIDLVNGGPLTITRASGFSRHTFINGSSLAHRGLLMVSTAKLDRTEAIFSTWRVLIRQDRRGGGRCRLLLILRILQFLLFVQIPVAFRIIGPVRTIFFVYGV